MVTRADLGATFGQLTQICVLVLYDRRVFEPEDRELFRSILEDCKIVSFPPGKTLHFSFVEREPNKAWADIEVALLALRF